MYVNFPAPAQAVMEARFGGDSLIALATLDGDRPSVRTVNAIYIEGAFYTITWARSNKLRDIARNPRVGICGDWFTGHGVAENLGWIRAEANRDLAARLRAAFAAWYDNGHTNEDDPDTVILRVRLTDGVLMDHGRRYELDFTASKG